MPQFDPTVLFVDITRERWEAAKDVIRFTDLIFRWSYHAIINIPFELHWDIYDNKINEDNPPLALYLCDDIIVGQDGHEILRLRPIHISTAFDPFLSNIHNLFVLERIVERLEKQHPNYAGERPLKGAENTLLLATPDNLEGIALYILWVWKRAMSSKKKIRDGDYSLTSDFWVEARSAVTPLISSVPKLLASPVLTTEVKDTPAWAHQGKYI